MNIGPQKNQYHLILKHQYPVYNSSIATPNISWKLKGILYLARLEIWQPYLTENSAKKDIGARNPPAYKNIQPKFLQCYNTAINQKKTTVVPD